MATCRLDGVDSKSLSSLRATGEAMRWAQQGTAGRFAVYYDRLDEAKAIIRQYERDAAHWLLEREARNAAARRRGS